MITTEMARAQSFALLIDLGTKLQVLSDRALYPTGFTTRQWFLCLVLQQASGSLMISDAARRMGTSRQNVKQLALKLEKKGYLTIARDPTDARALKLSLTESCIAFWDRRTAEDGRILDRLFACLPEVETIRLRESLMLLSGEVHRQLSNSSQPFAMEES